jgi:hypothetical protein
MKVMSENALLVGYEMLRLIGHVVAIAQSNESRSRGYFVSEK